MLFDMERDPYQMENLHFSEIPRADLEELLHRLAALLKRSNDPWYKRRLYADLIPYGAV
jgi:hypothetical protein